MVICLFNFIRNSWTALQIRTIFSFHRQNLKVLGIPHPICRTDYRTAWVACFREDYLCKVPMCWPVRRVCVCVCVCVRVHTRSVTQSCLILCNPMDHSPPSSSVHRTFQARILQWVAISYSRGYSRPRDRTCISCVSCISRLILCHCTTKEVPGNYSRLCSCFSGNSMAFTSPHHQPYFIQTQRLFY